MDVHELEKAWGALRSMEFPSHPIDDVLDDWILDLVEVDGFLAGHATTALSSQAPPVIVSTAARDLASKLDAIRVVPADTPTLEHCRRYVIALTAVEDALAGRNASSSL